MGGLGAAIASLAALRTERLVDEDINKVWYLQQNRIFREATEEGLIEHQHLFTMCEMPRGTRVFEVGDTERVIYFVKRGSVRIVRETADGKEVTVALLGPGDLFGEESLFDHGGRTTHAVVVEDALLCTSRADDLFALLSRDPVLALNVAKVLSERLDDARTTMEDLAYARVGERIEHARNGEPRTCKIGRTGAAQARRPGDRRTDGDDGMIGTLLLAGAVTLAPVLSATAWANAPGPPPTAGRVTIVDVFTFDCINCRHVTPELQRLRAAYGSRDLAIVGVHAPETAEEHVHANVVQALRAQNISWPVLFDDNFSVWNNYGVQAWPTQLVFDRKGVLRATYVGEGYDAQLARTVSTLIAEHA